MALLLKLENAALFLVLCLSYFHLGGSFWLFVIQFFTPDLAFLAYLAGPKAGAWIYNFTHSWVVAAALVLAFLVSTILSPDTAGPSILLELGLIMGAHITFDRMLGYGLKHESGFHDTHLGRIGQKP